MDENKEKNNNQDENKPEKDFKETQTDIENNLKRATMAAIGGVANAAEALVKSVKSVATKENLDKLAQRGEQAVQQVKDFSESTAKQVADFSTEAVNKMKKARDESKAAEASEEAQVTIEDIEKDIMASLNKAEDLIDRYVNQDKSDEKVRIVRELLKQKEEISNIKAKMGAIIEEESERIKKEKEKLGLNNDDDDKN